MKRASKRTSEQLARFVEQIGKKEKEKRMALGSASNIEAVLSRIRIFCVCMCVRTRIYSNTAYVLDEMISVEII
jgi:hypothetical protein